MVRINEHYLELKAGYLFPEIARRVKAFQGANPDARLIRLGIGDVTQALAPAVVAAFRSAVEEMGEASRFRGYGPEQGYAFLADAIIANDYAPRGVCLDPDEIFISDGSKCDVANIQELFSPAAKIAVTDPVYPVYVDTNIMSGRPLHYLSATAQNGFCPPPPSEAFDAIYLCSPNNPTGAVFSREQLVQWVDYAKRHRALILFDAAYEAFIQDSALPRSIYEIPGAKEVAIEFRSFSKTAGFTGTRCAFTVVPKGAVGYTESGKALPLNPLWLRRQTTKFNGVSYPVQRAAEACYSPNGKKEIRAQIAYYMENARLIREGLHKTGLSVYGGENAPYIWLKTPQDLDSWTFFDRLLKKAHVVGTPGAGFGAQGEGYFRLSAFGNRDATVEAIARIGMQISA